MDFLKLARARFSVRKYKNTPLEEEKLEKILEAARWAPSAVNFQPWHFIVINEKNRLEELHKVYKRDWLKEAPVIIVICSDHSQSWKRSSDGKDSADMDIAIAVDHITLMATQLGLGTCWVCNFNVDACSDILHLPKHLEPMVLLPLGYPNVDMPEKKRKPVSEIVSLNEYGKPFI